MIAILLFALILLNGQPATYWYERTHDTQAWGAALASTNHKCFADAFSYSVPGKWADVSLSDARLKMKSQFLLVFGNHTWVKDMGAQAVDAPSIPTTPVYDTTVGCAMLQKKGVDNIYFFGDSYMRQVYAAVLITLSGNYHNGSISDSEYAMNSGAARCEFHYQFNEKVCGVRQLNELAHVCGGKVTLHHMHHGVYGIDKCRRRVQQGGPHSRAINLFSVGNHPIRGGRNGVNDPAAHAEHFDGLFCRQLQKEKEEKEKGGKDVSNGCSNWWMSTHQRIIGWFDDEKTPASRRFNEGMRSFFDSGRCGDYSTVDVYNMTSSLIETFTLDATCEANKQKSMSVSYDYFHYGMEINLLKAQLALDAWATGMPDADADALTQPEPQPRRTHHQLRMV